MRFWYGVQPGVITSLVDTSTPLTNGLNNPLAVMYKRACFISFVSSNDLRKYCGVANVAFEGFLASSVSGWPIHCACQSVFANKPSSIFCGSLQADTCEFSSQIRTRQYSCARDANACPCYLIQEVSLESTFLLSQRSAALSNKAGDEATCT